LEIGKENVKISILQFADSIMFMCKTTIQNIVAIKGILRCFELTSSLKANLQKVNFTYLRILIGGNHKRREFWRIWFQNLRRSYLNGKENISLWLVGLV